MATNLRHNNRLARAAAKVRDDRIDRLYRTHCAGVQIPISEIPNVFRAASAAMAHMPQISDADLAKVIINYAATIRRNLT
jgi:hypothetical protein